ncbi:unnamed protein product [Sphacelaria rigidula]
MVDSGTSGHYFDDTLIPGLRYKLHNYQELAAPRTITTAGGHHLAGVGKGLLRGHIQDGEGVKRLVQISCLVVPGLGRNLFSVKQATRNGVVSIFDMNNPRLETNNFTVPLQELESDLSGNDASGLDLQAADAATLWHRRMGHLNSNSLNLLKNVGSNGVDFGGAVSYCDICAKSSTGPPGDSRQQSATRISTSHDRFDGTDHARSAGRLQVRLQDLR